MSKSPEPGIYALGANQEWVRHADLPAEGKTALECLQLWRPIGGPYAYKFLIGTIARTNIDTANCFYFQSQPWVYCVVTPPEMKSGNDGSNP